MNLTAIAAHIHNVDCDVEATYGTDDQGAYSVITVTVADTGEPLFEDDDYIDGHITQADLVRFAGQYARNGRLDDAEFEAKNLADVIEFPVVADEKTAA